MWFDETRLTFASENISGRSGEKCFALPLEKLLERSLSIMQRKAYKTEQVLSLQSYKAQQELKSRQQELDKVNTEKDNLKKKSDWVEARYSDLMSLQGRNSSQSSEFQNSFDVSDLQQKVEDLNSSLVKQNEDMQLFCSRSFSNISVLFCNALRNS
jgi:predicted nuclease with TOPRIM domain